MIKLRDDIVFDNPQSRIQEYCEIEVCQGYDDKHSVNDIITKEDVLAANELYANINRYDRYESKRLLSRSKSISRILSTISNVDILHVKGDEWPDLRNKVGGLLDQFLSVKGIGIAKATKILHLKRPNLFPVLDSYVIKFLLDIDISQEDKPDQRRIALEALDLIRETMVKQRAEFEKLGEKLSVLPIPLTAVRVFDILCWTAEKWDIRRKLNAPHGTPNKSLLLALKARKQTTSDIEKAVHQGYVVIEDFERATGPKVHTTDCFYYKRWLKNPSTTTTWHGPYKSEGEAWKICCRLSSKTGFEPTKHKCVS